MKVYTDALALLGWLAQRESASVSEITASGLMGSREASDVIRYALRNGVVERANGEAARRGSARYRSTGVPLPEPRSRNVEASFDGLLHAWGITTEPLQRRVLDARVHQISDAPREI
ncbi:hypothetical protein SB783_35120 [Paraburkholderia sp. SIMBA_009]|uniref:hypothetical protein n=1 Tax=Paraburkholderia tropica TaxID=92647 RepID=UPI0016026E79|nr:hypothetical protein [Paraburkholderia tropica]QNB17279.1 hypothetical protein G5S35_37250 [Paraburkholderia tropica]